MAKLFILIGIPGAGKSTWAKENLNHYQMFTEIFSSDEYRQKMFGDYKDQTHNQKLFETLHKDVKKALEEGKDICYDATNVSRKDRRGIINIGKQVRGTEIIGVLFIVSENLLYRQNANRENKVPDYVIEKFIKRFEIPFEGEGFDRIDYVFHKDKDDKLIDMKNIESLMKGFDQNNHHHTLDLYEHCVKCADIVSEESCDRNLILASLYHDLGKLYTQTTDENGESHYLGHHNVGAYKALFINWGTECNVLDIAFYINYHMEPYFVDKMNDKNKKRTIQEFGDKWKNIMLIHKGDRGAH